MATSSITLLGSTGSIGTSTLDIVQKFPDHFSVDGLVAGNNVERLAEQVDRHKPSLVATKTEEGAEKLRSLLGSKSKAEILWGDDGADRVAQSKKSTILISAIVGAAGLRPTLAAVKEGKTIALANKESLVVAGALVCRTAQKSGATLIPVDSEHSAIFQALQGSNKKGVKKIILTASGGPFFLHPEIDLNKVTVDEALNHPNWDMGPKITIDSATMMNKGLEIIEARWLFGFTAEKIDVVVHPQSVIHSMVEFVDGSILAQLGVPDMRGPISYALAYPERLKDVMEPLDFAKTRELTFRTPDHERFPAIRLAKKALSLGETHPAVLNGANEVAVTAFLSKEIGFMDIPKIVQEVLFLYPGSAHESLEAFLDADTWGRTQANELIGQKKRK